MISGELFLHELAERQEIIQEMKQSLSILERRQQRSFERYLLTASFRRIQVFLVRPDDVVLETMFKVVTWERTLYTLKREGQSFTLYAGPSYRGIVNTEGDGKNYPAVSQIGVSSWEDVIEGLARRYRRTKREDRKERRK